MTEGEKCDRMNAINEYRRRRMRRLVKRMKEAETQQEALRLAIIIYTTCFNRKIHRDGGPGSGNFGHEGRPGEIGGSAPSDGATAKSSGSFGGATTKHFASAVSKAKTAVAAKTPEIAWRVTAHTQQELDEEYPGAKLHVTDGGSTVAVTADGDVISVCKKPGDKTNGKELMNLAVANGGTKLDSYSGNHGFYVKCGFEAVSWCEWDDGGADEGWINKEWLKVNGLNPNISTAELSAIPNSALKVPREPVVFYKYTGNTSQSQKVGDILNLIPASQDYDAARASRDELL